MILFAFAVRKTGRSTATGRLRAGMEMSEMVMLSAPARGLALMSLIVLLALGPGPVHAGPAAPGEESARHQLLPGAQDPDDDDDGIVDELDSEPNNPQPDPGPEEEDITSPVQDSDGDGIPNVQDPDDDNGGVSDEDDPAPFDPEVEPPPPSDPLSPVDDDDGDGIPNIQDPDDDNDGASDDEDPGNPSAPVEPGEGNNGGGGAVVAQPVASVGADAPVVTALPVTGAGFGPGGLSVASLVIVAAAGMLGSALALRWRGRGAG